ncbi:MAG: hypothetical protein M3214_08815 [Actinomycetota bacterium]|nr:hypothetical protein [Actinomycetota bacterium]
MTWSTEGRFVFWRAANIVGWSLGALVVGAALSFLMSILFVDILDGLMDGVVPVGFRPLQPRSRPARRWVR